MVKIEGGNIPMSICLCICSSSEVCQEVACRVVMWCVLSAVAGSSCPYTSMQENKLPLYFKEALGFR